MQAGPEKDFLPRQNGSLRHREPTAGNGHGAMSFTGRFCNNSFGKATPVDAFNKGMSPYGVIDLVGNVWQMTNDMYFNGSYYFTVIRGGSFYKPDSSWWYIQGGPQPLDKTQIMLMVSQGYDRNATVGFRCVKDIDREAFKIKSKK